MLAETNHLPGRRIDEVLDLVGLTEVADRRAGKFSLGMGQRLGIAAALLGDPGVLLFDEPVNGLDPDGIRWVRNLLKGLAREGRTVFVSSHLMSEMALTADEVVVIGRGRLITETSIEELTAQSSQRYVSVRSPEVGQAPGRPRGARGRSSPQKSDGSLSVRGLEAAADRRARRPAPGRPPRAGTARRLARGGLHGADRGQHRVPGRARLPGDRRRSTMSIAAVPPVTSRRASIPPGRYGLSGLLRSEWTKLRTVRSTIWSFAIIIVLGIGLGALATAETRAHWATMGFGDRASFDATRMSLIGVFFAQLVIGVLGVLVVTSEYGTGTIRATFAAAPRRPLVLVAKAAVFAAVSLVVSEVVAFVSYLLGQALLSAPATHTTLASPGALRAVVGSGLYLCVLGLIALALGVIIRHTAGGIGAFVGVLLVLPLVISALPSSIADDLQRFLPANIGSELVSLHQSAHDFTPWAGFAVLCAYAAALLLLGGALLVRRDA